MRYMKQIKKRVILFGYGNVGKEFVSLLSEKKDHIKEKYGLELVLCEVVSRNGSIYDHKGINTEVLLDCGKGSQAIAEYSKRVGREIQPAPLFAGDILVEATPTDIASGQPGLEHILRAIEKGMDVAAISKGALVSSFKKIKEMAAAKGVKIKYSGATAAALPTIDLGQYSLAGCTIKSIEGILNGTTNYILTRMHHDGISFTDALKEAREKGIAEANSDLDTRGIDSACKILLLSNSLMGTELELGDIRIKGIEDITIEDIMKAKHDGNLLKLIARAYTAGSGVKIEVCPMGIAPEHLLAGVSGTNKGIVFDTDSMGRVAASGGASNPRGAAAAALKDIINMYI